MPSRARRRAPLRPDRRLGGRGRHRGLRARGVRRRSGRPIRAAGPPARTDGGRSRGRGGRLVRLPRLPAGRAPRARAARAAAPRPAAGLLARLLRQPAAPRRRRAMVVRGALDRCPRRRPRATPRGASAAPRAGRAVAAALGGHARALAPGHERPSGGGGGLSRADRRGRDLPGERVPAPRRALVGRPRGPVRTRRARVGAASRRPGCRAMGSAVQRLPRAVPAHGRPSSARPRTGPRT
jgi:hypothetical protein